ncbi:hypothetical protein NDU88_002573 [Pleurodeles waltl]|uniref:Uncharacterized protein n=1 Tax=Pleurodeles waltl TaxID=8319 RepID=A0AAV7TM80_PLEWA|nr:hypothetical protein NDU88_002573 [Pleurodeles waltl]
MIQVTKNRIQLLERHDITPREAAVPSRGGGNSAETSHKGGELYHCTWGGQRSPLRAMALKVSVSGLGPAPLAAGPGIRRFRVQYLPGFPQLLHVTFRGTLPETTDCRKNYLAGQLSW